ncbi:hypothetical protein [Ferruginibacter sp.]|uniref:hypothetical protein n=1 Tax=Ferruginibacter sp. TaxID=1940288 RepID=UPI00198B7D6B|nr:hypothetical protein [Ferruginibacter sp.]MBC7629418.1 hypothetical protein [Ferruginibacter sp.]
MDKLIKTARPHNLVEKKGNDIQLSYKENSQLYFEPHDEKMKKVLKDCDLGDFILDHKLHPVSKLPGRRGALIPHLTLCK